MTLITESLKTAFENEEKILRILYVFREGWEHGYNKHGLIKEKQNK